MPHTAGVRLPTRFVPVGWHLCHPRGTRPLTLLAPPSDRPARLIHKSFLVKALRGGSKKPLSPERPLPWSVPGKGKSTCGDPHPRPTGVPEFPVREGGVQPCTRFLSTPSRLTYGAGKSGRAGYCSAAAPPRPRSPPRGTRPLSSTPERADVVQPGG